ncbi:MAG: FAD-dependent oxidoreductase, partial [Paracoccaceae bacterium]
MKMSAFWWDIEESLSSSVQHVLPAEADFVVVGGGYTGLSAGLSIARQGRSVVVLDSGAPGFGASTRNGGICSGQIRLSHGELSAKFGTDFADEAYSEGIEARLDLAKFCEEEKIECQFQMTGRFTGAMSARDYDTQAREVDRLNRVVGHKAYMVERKDQNSEISTDLFHGGM